MKPKSSVVLIAVAFTFLTVAAPTPNASGVVPRPDGCYPSFTTAEGCDALNLLTSGAANTALGWRSLFSNTTGGFNTGVGTGTLVLNNADSNTAVGAAAMLLNMSGANNVAVGAGALVFNDSGNSNSALGAFALYNNLDGFSNSAFGSSALSGNISAYENTAVGHFALANNDVTGSGLAIQNTAVGNNALIHNIDGHQNTAVGVSALFNNTAGINNTAIGLAALGSATGQNNIGIGAFAGNNITTGDFNIHIFAPGTSNDDRTIRIGDATQTATYIGGISGATVPGGVSVIIDAFGHVGTVVSSQRFKDQIEPMENASEAIFALRPVTFRYKKELDPDSISQFGLVAEEVEKVAPDLVARNAKGGVYTVRYEAVNAMLLNEFLKEHRRVEEQQAAIAALQSELQTVRADQQRGIQILTARLEQQAANIQKVNDSIELTKSAREAVAQKD